jgi:malate/lactate dehydrogenase
MRVGGWELGVGSVMVFLSLASSAWAQQTLPDRLSREARDSMQQVIRHASAAGLPVDPLYAKAAEGVLKKADDARILLAVRNLARALADARDALPVGAAQGTIVAAASALQAGVERHVIARYVVASREKGSETDLAVAYVTLADLIASSVPMTAAASSVESLLRDGLRDTELAAFRAAVVQDIQAGAKPEEALRARIPMARRP